ncbi:uncharacterized protein P7C70_g6767, partial [Phenoliferia sp. Uapishka_3]
MSNEVAAERQNLEVKTPAGPGDLEYDAANSPTLSRQRTIGGHIAHDELHAIPAYHRKSANAMPLGCLSFAGTVLLMSLYSVGARGVITPNAGVTFAVAIGGLVELFAGNCEFAAGNSFGAVTFTSFALFWWGYAMLFIPFFGITGTYDGTAGTYTATGAGALEINDAFGIFFITWFVVSLIITIGSIRSSVAVLSWMVSWNLTLLLHACSYWNSSNTKILHAAGGMGLVCAFASFYVGVAGLLTDESSYFRLPMGSLRRKEA